MYDSEMGHITGDVYSSDYRSSISRVDEVQAVFYVHVRPLSCSYMYMQAYVCPCLFVIVFARAIGG